MNSSFNGNYHQGREKRDSFSPRIHLPPSRSRKANLGFFSSSLFQADGTYETQSNLDFTASRFENGGTLTCEAINSVMIERDEAPMKSTLILEVLCKFFFPTGSRFFLV